jgi:hypothetical protein
MDELVEEAGLPHARLADHRDHLPAPLGRSLEGALEQFHLGIPPHEAREPARRCAFEPRPHGARAGDLIDIDGLAQPLDPDGAQRRDGDVALGASQCVRGHHDRAGGGQLLHASGQMGGLAHGGVVHAQVAPDGAHDHIARVQANPDLDGDPLIPADAFRVLPHGFLHPERRVARAHGVILVGEGGAKERHDPVAHHLIHGALVAVNRIHH